MRIEASRGDDAAACEDRGKQQVDDAADMVQFPHAQHAVLCGQVQRAGDLARSGQQVGMGQGNQLAAPRGARGHQHDGKVGRIGRGKQCIGLRGSNLVKVEQGQVQHLCGFGGGGNGLRQGQHGGNAGHREIRQKFGQGRRGVERHGDTRDGRGEQGLAHLCPRRQDDGDTAFGKALGLKSRRKGQDR